MSRVTVVPDSRPGLFDFLLLLAGCALSRFLVGLGLVEVVPGPQVTESVKSLVQALPDVMRMAEGVILLWPLFFLVQLVLRRKQGMTSGEWLSLFACFGTAVLTGLAAWIHWGSPPNIVGENTSRLAVIWYVVFVPALALIAVILFLIDCIGGWKQPWTHSLSLSLIIWPVGPLIAILSLGKFA